MARSRAINTRSSRRITLTEAEMRRLRTVSAREGCKLRCDKDPTGYSFNVLPKTSKSPRLANVRRELEHEFERLRQMDEAGDDRMADVRLCRDNLVSSQYLKHAVRQAEYIAYGMLRGELVSVILAYTHHHRGVDGWPVCQPHEIYMV